MTHELASTPSQAAPLVPYTGSLPKPDRLAVVMDKLPQLTSIAAQLFPGEVTVEVEEDPEIEGRRYVVFSVETKDDTKAVANRRLEWFRLTSALLGDDEDLVHLFVIFRQ